MESVSSSSCVRYLATTRSDGVNHAGAVGTAIGQVANEHQLPTVRVHSICRVAEYVQKRDERSQFAMNITDDIEWSV